MKIAVLGGGVSGLTSAITLARKGYKVTIFEKKQYLGGLAGAFKVGDTSLDFNYRHIFKTDTAALEWIKHYGLDIGWYDSRMGYYTNNKIFSFGKPQDLLCFKPLSWIGRFRFALGTLKIKNDKLIAPLEQETAKNYLIRTSGQEVFDVIWKPLLVAKFGSEYEKIAAIWIWGKIALRGRSRSNTGFKEQLGYIKGSFIELINAMHTELVNLGAIVLTKSEILRVEKHHSGGFTTIYTGSDRLLAHDHFDYVLSALPLPEFIAAGAPLSTTEKDTWEKIKYTAASTLILIMNQRFSNMYWLNIGDRNIPFGGLIEHTNFVPAKWYNNKHILYISHYMFESDEFYGKTKEQLFELYLPYLKKINPKFSKDNVLAIYGGQGKHAQPLIEINYNKLKPDYATSCLGLFHVGMAHIYPEDRGINFAIKTGAEAANCLMNNINSPN